MYHTKIQFEWSQAALSICWALIETTYVRAGFQTPKTHLGQEWQNERVFCTGMNSRRHVFVKNLYQKSKGTSFLLPLNCPHMGIAWMCSCIPEDRHLLKKNPLLHDASLVFNLTSSIVQHMFNFSNVEHSTFNFRRLTYANILSILWGWSFLSHLSEESTGIISSTHSLPKWSSFPPWLLTHLIPSFCTCWFSPKYLLIVFLAQTYEQRTKLSTWVACLPRVWAGLFEIVVCMESRPLHRKPGYGIWSNQCTLLDDSWGCSFSVFSFRLFRATFYYYRVSVTELRVLESSFFPRFCFPGPTPSVFISHNLIRSPLSANEILAF